MCLSAVYALADKGFELLQRAVQVLFLENGEYNQYQVPITLGRCAGKKVKRWGIVRHEKK